MFSGLKVLAVALSLAPLAAAQATTLPQCALGCAKTDAIQAGCDLSDTTCLCKTSFSANVAKCSTTTSCSQAEQAQVGVILTAMCGGGSSGSQSASASSSIPGNSSSSPSSSGVPSSTSGSTSASTSTPASASATSTAPPTSSSRPPSSSSSPLTSSSASSSASTSASPSSTGNAQGIPSPARPAAGIAAAIFLSMWLL